MIVESSKYVGNGEGFDFILFKGEVDFFGLFGADNKRK